MASAGDQFDASAYTETSTTGISIPSSGAHSHTMTSSGGTEVRVKNIAVNWIIKAKAVVAIQTNRIEDSDSNTYVNTSITPDNIDFVCNT